MTPRVLSHNCVQVVTGMSVSFSVRSFSDTRIEVKCFLPARNLEVTGETQKRTLRQTVISARKVCEEERSFSWKDPRKHRHTSVSISSFLNK